MSCFATEIGSSTSSERRLALRTAQSGKRISNKWKDASDKLKVEKSFHWF